VFGSVFSAVVVEAEPVLRRWLLDRDDTVLQYVAVLLVLSLVTGLFGAWFGGLIEKVLSVMFAGTGLVVCLVMLTVLLTEARGGEN